MSVRNVERSTGENMTEEGIDVLKEIEKIINKYCSNGGIRDGADGAPLMFVTYVSKSGKILKAGRGDSLSGFIKEYWRKLERDLKEVNQ